MRNIKTDQAANAVAYACASKYPSSTGSVNPAKVRCNGEEVDTNKTGTVEFPVPNEFGILKIVKLNWEPLYKHSSDNIFKVYIQHSYPFNINGFYLQGYNERRDADSTYWCSGMITPNAVGAAKCQNVQSTSKTFSVKSVVTPEVNIYELSRSLKKC